MKNRKVKILGATYTIKFLFNDEYLINCDGYCDKTSRRIVVRIINNDNSDLGDKRIYQNKCLRHEIIHAFLFESGLSENAIFAAHGTDHPEQMVDWIAYQYPKIKKVFKKLGIEE